MYAHPRIHKHKHTHSLSLNGPPSLSLSLSSKPNSEQSNCGILKAWVESKPSVRSAETFRGTRDLEPSRTVKSYQTAPHQLLPDRTYRGFWTEIVALLSPLKTSQKMFRCSSESLVEKNALLEFLSQVDPEVSFTKCCQCYVWGSKAFQAKKGHWACLSVPWKATSPKYFKARPGVEQKGAYIYYATLLALYLS